MGAWDETLLRWSKLNLERGTRRNCGNKKEASSNKLKGDRARFWKRERGKKVNETRNLKADC